MDDPLSLLTRDGRRVLNEARQIARRYNRTVVASDMLLLSVLQLTGSQTEEMLQRLHLKLNDLTARLSASLKLEAAQEQLQPEIGYSRGKLKLSTGSTTILHEAWAEAEQHQLDFVDPRLLLLGMLRAPDTKAGQFLGQYGLTLDQARAQARLEDEPPTNLARFNKPSLSLDSLYFGISPIFIGLVLFTGLSAYFTYAGIGNSRAFMFFFVIGAWVISVALHEFGHALTAYLGGDDSVVDQGYLTLNPLKYTHPFLSIFLPVLFLIMGGIGLPGGAVYINPMALKSPGVRSLTSAAGPIATVICAVLLALPFIFGWYSYEAIMAHFEFWAGLALLVFLQITALGLNLLPIPGLDGFGIAEPLLPPELAQKINVIRPFGFFLLIGLLFFDTPVRDLFWGQIWETVAWIDPVLAPLAGEGLSLFRLWG